MSESSLWLVPQWNSTDSSSSEPLPSPWWACCRVHGGHGLYLQSDSTGIWSQGLVLVRQEVYHLRDLPSCICLFIIWMQSLVWDWPQNTILLPTPPRITSIHHNAQVVFELQFSQLLLPEKLELWTLTTMPASYISVLIMEVVYLFDWFIM
jgi:hypothetical protein